VDQPPDTAVDLRGPAAPLPVTTEPGTLVVGEERAAALEALAARADAHAAAARSARTRTAYAGDWAHFTGWCARAGRAALPAAVSTVRLYLTDLEAARDESGAVIYQPATLARRLAAIAAAHRDAGLPSPTRDPAVTAVLIGIKRARAAPPHRMRPLMLDDVRALLAQMEWSTWPGGLLAARDGFVALAGFAGALRRSELAALQIRDLFWQPADGLHLRIRTSKTDQDSVGATVVLPYGRNAGTCPPCAGLRWLRLLAAARCGRQALMRAVLATPPWPEQTHLYPHPDREDTSDEDTGDGSPVAGEGNADCRAPVPDLPAGMPLLRAVRKGGHLLESPVTGDALHAMVQRRAAAAGLSGPVGFHSLRAGFVTTARRNGADHRAVRRQTRHSSDAMVELYDRDYTPLAGNAVTHLGL
jgi:integrase